MGDGARIAVLGVAIAAVVALFIVLSGGNDDEPTTTAASTTTTTEETTANQGKPDKEKPKPEPKPQVPLIDVKGGQPVGGVNKLDFEAGGQILFDVGSDTDMTFHLHGYDVEQSVAAGQTTRFDLPADIEGVFELEEHDLATPIAEITVSP